MRPNQPLVSILCAAVLLMACADDDAAPAAVPSATTRPPTTTVAAASTAPSTGTEAPDSTTSSTSTTSTPPAPCEPTHWLPGYPVVDHYVTYSRTRTWTAVPVRCDPSTASTSPDVVTPDTVDLTGTTMADPSDVVTVRVSFRDIPVATGGLGLLGITDEASYWRTENAAIRIDLDSGQIAAVPFMGNEQGPSCGVVCLYPAGFFTTPVGLLGDTVIVNGGDRSWRADFESGSLVPFAAPAVPCGALWNAGAPYPEQAGAPEIITPHDEVWCTERASRDNPGRTVATRLGADGSVTTTPPIDGSGYVFAGGGSLWTFVALPGQGMSTPLHPARVDPETGEFLVLLDAPAESFPPGIGFGGAYVNSDGMLALADRNRAWWVSNDGDLERLAPMDFDVIGITESHYIAVRDDGTVVSGELADLAE